MKRSRVCDRMQRLREALSIAGSQSFIWLRFETAVKAILNVSPRLNSDGTTPISYPSLPTVLGNELLSTLIRVEACRTLLESVDTLYAVLSHKQRRLADRLLTPVVSEALSASIELRGRALAA